MAQEHKGKGPLLAGKHLHFLSSFLHHHAGFFDLPMRLQVWSGKQDPTFA